MMRDAAPDVVAEIEFSVPSMVCDGCAENIDKALKAIPGVLQVKPKLWRKRVLVRYEPSKVVPMQIKDAIGGAGFSAVEA